MEKLIAELRGLVEQMSFGPALRHPLVYAVPYFDSLNHIYNEQLLVRKREVEKATEERNFQTAVFLHERPWRIHAFRNLSVQMPDDIYWQLLGEVWSDTENFWQNKKVWIKVFQSPRKQKHEFMDSAEQAALRALPAKLKIYRGHHSKNQSGISYTLDRKIAEWFAQRVAIRGSGQVTERTVTREDVFAVLLNRNENEVLVIPKREK